MNLTDLMLAITTYALFVAGLTQLIKDARGLDGWKVLLTSVGVGTISGALLAGGGVVELQALTLYPAWASGAVLGLLSGLTASGGKALVTSVQTTGAWARAEAQQEVKEEASDSGAADGWEPTTLNDMAQTRTGADYEQT